MRDHFLKMMALFNELEVLGSFMINTNMTKIDIIHQSCMYSVVGRIKCPLKFNLIELNIQSLWPEQFSKLFTKSR